MPPSLPSSHGSKALARAGNTPGARWNQMTRRLRRLRPLSGADTTRRPCRRTGRPRATTRATRRSARTDSSTAMAGEATTSGRSMRAGWAAATVVAT